MSNTTTIAYQHTDPEGLFAGATDLTGVDLAATESAYAEQVAAEYARLEKLEPESVTVELYPHSYPYNLVRGSEYDADSLEIAMERVFGRGEFWITTSASGE